MLPTASNTAEPTIAGGQRRATPARSMKAAARARRQPPAPPEPADPWSTFLFHLDAWVSRHGHANVPQAATETGADGDPYALGLRVARYRALHRRGELSPDRVQQLEQRPGWTWSAATTSTATRWNANTAALAAHAAEHGSLTGITRALQAWLLRQRADRDNLTPAQLAQLRQIPGALDDRRNRVDDFVRAARVWLKRHRDKTLNDVAYSTVIAIDGEPYPLGRRITYYRRRYAGHEPNSPAMNPADVQAIETLPGWTWPLKERAPQRGWRQPDPT